MNTFSQLFAQKPGSLAAQDFFNRRIFLRNGAAALSTAALAGLLPRGAQASSPSSKGSFPNFAPKAKRVIYLFQVEFFFHLPRKHAPIEVPAWARIEFLEVDVSSERGISGRIVQLQTLV